MVSDDYIKKTVQNDLKKISVDSVGTYARKHRAFIDELYKDGKIDDASIDKSLEKTVLLQANKDIDRINSFKTEGREIFLDDWGLHPECLVYAWHNGFIDDANFVKIPIDHGYTMATISERYNPKNVIPSLRKIILTEKFVPSMLKGSSYECISSCCYH